MLRKHRCIYIRMYSVNIDTQNVQMDTVYIRRRTTTLLLRS